MTGLFRRGDRLERELRLSRPEPSAELASRIEARLRADRPLRRGAWRVAVPVAFTGTLLVALAALGGIGYAASSIEQAARSVTHVFSPAKTHGVIVVRSLSSGGDQYRPGFGFGDPNHVHTGPPGLTPGGGNGGSFAPPLSTKTVGDYKTVKTSITLDEQAALYLSVVTKKGKGDKNALVISQKHSKVGGGTSGSPVKNLHYTVLVPRTIPLNLAIPKGLLQPGKTYYIRVTAISPLGTRSVLYIPFTG